MGTTVASTLYPLDPTGTLASNLISGETQLLMAANGAAYRTFMPTYGPFFVNSFSAKLTQLDGSVKNLVYGVDIYAAYTFISASLAVASPVAGAIVVMDLTLVGTVTCTYQTLGGAYVLDLATITEILANAQANPLITSWEDITNLPSIYPPVDHNWDITDMVGANEVVTALDEITQALLQTGSQGLADHLADHNNPHVTTAAQVGAYTTTQTDQAIAASATTLSTATTAVQTALNNHLADNNNPHNTNATEVGLGNVPNYAMASTADAVAGTRSDAFMSPRTVLLAMNNGPSSALNLHIVDHTNPHQVTATQVGLGNVLNYGIATNAQALAGTSASLYMTPANTAYTIASGVGATLTAHVGNTTNPHNVTATQVGLGNVLNYGIAASSDAVAGSSNTLYMTPLMVKAAMDGYTPATLTAHIQNVSNPHNTTAAQVGAYTTAQVDTLLSAKLATTAQAADSLLFAGNSVQQLSLTILGGTAANSTLFGNQSVAQLTAAILNGTAANASAVGGLSLTQLDARYSLAAGTTKQIYNANLKSSAGTATNIWTPLANIVLPTDLTVTSGQLPDVQWYLAGGDQLTDTNSSLYYIRLSTRGGSTSAFKLSSKVIGDYTGTQTFGFTVASVSGVQSVTIWMKSKDALSPVSITELQHGVGTINTAPTVVTVEPTGIIYANS